MSDLVLDTTVGGDSSNSYGTLDEMITYFTGRSDALSFLEATSQEQIARLIQATVINDLLLNAFGSRTSETQSLEFPRTNLVDRHGRKYTDNEIPAKIKFAQFEQALYLFTTSIKVPSILTQGFKSAKLDTMAIEVDRSMIPQKLDYDAVDFLGDFGDVDASSRNGVKQINLFRY